MTIGDGAIRKKTGKAIAAGLQYTPLSPDIQKGILLTCKRGIGQVLGRGR